MRYLLLNVSIAELANQATPGFRLRGDLERPFHVLSGKDRPDESFAADQYRDYWYWIENSDIATKRVFTLMLFLTTLTNNAGEYVGSVLTIATV